MKFFKLVEVFLYTVTLIAIILFVVLVLYIMAIK